MTTWKEKMSELSAEIKVGDLVKYVSAASAEDYEMNDGNGFKIGEIYKVVEIKKEKYRDTYFYELELISGTLKIRAGLLQLEIEKVYSPN